MLIILQSNLKEHFYVLFFILFIGDIMLLIKSFMIGIGKIIPGVSGAILAINFGIYERLLNALTCFFNDWRNNFKFLLVVILGGVLGIVIGSKVLLVLFNNYQFLTLMFFNGLIIGGSYIFAKGIRYQKKDILLVLIITLITIASFIPFKSMNIDNNIMFLLGGFIEVFASIVPGISATSLLMLIGIYDHVLLLISNIDNLSYVISNFNIYLYFGIGMFLSFIINLYLVKFCLNKYPHESHLVVLGLSIASILYLLINTFKLSFNGTSLILGIVLFIWGIIINKYLV